MLPVVQISHVYI